MKDLAYILFFENQEGDPEEVPLLGDAQPMGRTSFEHTSQTLMQGESTQRIMGNAPQETEDVEDSTIAVHPELPSLKQLAAMYSLRKRPHSLQMAKGIYQMKFHFASNIINGKFQGKSGWVAVLHVVTPNVNNLISRGFHWDSTNIVSEMHGVEWCSDWPANCYVPHQRKKPRGRVPAKRYFLADKKSTPSQWIGCLVVYAIPDRHVNGYRAVLDFKVTDLMRKQIYHCYIYSKAQGYIYLYNSDNPKNNTNKIYPYGPLTGWWPWPRKEINKELDSKRVKLLTWKANTKKIIQSHIPSAKDRLRTMIGLGSLVLQE